MLISVILTGRLPQFHNSVTEHNLLHFLGGGENKLSAYVSHCVGFLKESVFSNKFIMNNSMSHS